MTRSTPRTPDPSAVDASLHLLAHQVLDGLRDDRLDPCLLHVAPTDDGIDLGFRPLDGAHPTDLLLGFTAPEPWHAVGMATAGWAHHVDDRRSPERHRRRVLVVTIVSRSGEVAHRVHAVDDPDLTELLAGTGESLEGEQIDLLRRVLGSETSPPPCGTESFWAGEWLAAVIATEGVTSWGEVADLHPAMRLLDADSGGTARRYGLVPVATAFAQTCGWAELRRLAAEGTHEFPDLDPTAAHWLDDGSFARFVLSRCPPPAALRDRVRGIVDDVVGQRIDRTLEELGVPEHVWPDRRVA